jgi:tetratricopeptide (TPR) repeat protein
MRDLVLRMESGRLWGRRLSVEEPKTPKTSPGTFHDPPSGYSLGDVDVESLVRWAEQCVSDSILALVADMYPSEQECWLRVLVTASEKLLPTMMTAPWEVLELAHVNQVLPYYERLNVVRVVSSRVPPAQPTPAGTALRVAVTWANPKNDIPGLAEHIDDLLNLARDHPRELEIIGPLEFTSVESVLDHFANAHPHICYHIGHANQSPGEKVSLLIGSSAAPAECDVDKFRELLQEIGPPRLLLLSACAAAVGFSPNAYLGAALSCASQIDAVIAMQAPVPVFAAITLASTLFTSLANEVGLAESLKRARSAIQRQERLVAGRGLSFTSFIPILVQRTRQNNIFTVDKSGRELSRLLTSLKQVLERVEPYLERSHDKDINEFLAAPKSAQRVAVVKGARGNGKSTSVRRIVRMLLTQERFRAGQRCLYYDAQHGSLPSAHADDRILALLTSFASSAAHTPLTASLKRKLKALQPDTPGEAIPRLVAWLREEHEQGKRYAICLDSVPPDLASTIARRASSILEDFGSLLLVADEAEIEPSLPIRVISVDCLTRDEIKVALVGLRPGSDDSVVDRILQLTNGIPYLVAGYLRCTGTTGPPLADLGEAYLRDVAPALSSDEERALGFAAYCGIPMPAVFLAPGVLTTLTAQRHLLIGSEADFYTVPDILRGPLRRRFAENSGVIHECAFNKFVALAEQHEASRDEITFQLVTLWMREALRHGLSLMERAEPEAVDEIRDPVLGLAEKLHDRYLNEADDVGPAMAMWQDYRAVTESLGRFDDRSADTHYADCLVRMGKYDEADDLLEAVTSAEDVDPIKVTALLLRNVLLKGRGRRGDFSDQIALLREALEVVRKLQPPAATQQWIDQQTAGLQFTLGNALGYGEDAKPAEGLQHVGDARRLFEQLGDAQQFGAVAEEIEIRRYNAERGLFEFSAEDRQKAIQALRANYGLLITRAMRGEAIRHLYELGRLETDAGKRAEWFKLAYQRAGDAYAPWGLHAAIKWRIAQIEAGLVQFENVASELKGYAEKLTALCSRAWSRRVRRNTWRFIAERYEQAGNMPAAFAALMEAWAAVLKIADYGEGTGDLATRRDIARRYGMLALRCGKEQVARGLLAELGLAIATERFADLSTAELEQIFSEDRRGAA